MSPYRHEIWTNASMTSFRSPRTSAGVKLLTTHCPDGGQNFFFGGSNYQLSGPWLFFLYEPHEPLMMMWSCVPLPVQFDWLLAGDYFIPQRLKWYQFNSQIAQVFVQHFRLGLRICPFCCSFPITQYVVWHAAKCKWLFTPALLVVAMVCLLYQGNKIHGNR